MPTDVFYDNATRAWLTANPGSSFTGRHVLESTVELAAVTHWRESPCDDSDTRRVKSGLAGPRADIDAAVVGPHSRALVEMSHEPVHRTAGLLIEEPAEALPA